jgi:hypothetical protein
MSTSSLRAVPAGLRTVGAPVGLRAAGEWVSGPLPPRQSARCLRFISEHPGASNTEVQDGLSIRHPSQVSEVLLRLERDGLAHTKRGQRSLNHWQLTDHGAALLDALPEGIYE